MAKSPAPQVVQDWAETFSRTGTQGVYTSLLDHYYHDSLASKYSSVDAWVEKILKDQDKRETRSKRALELKHFLDSYVSDRTGGHLSYSAKVLLVSAVKSFIAYTVGKDVAEQWNYKIEPTVEEVDEKATRKAMSLNEVKALYDAAQNNRDKASVACLASTGLGPRELIQFTTQLETIVIRAKPLVGGLLLASQGS